MDLYVLDKHTREIINPVNGYESVIWTPRYYEPGDFEIYIQATEENFELLQLDRYVMRYDDSMIGIIEDIKTDTDPDKGDFFIVTGRCAKSLLDRRIVWSMTNIKDTVENGLRQLVTENFISPNNVSRVMPNFVLGGSQGFTETMEAQFTGDNILEIFINQCKQHGIGFRVVLNDDLNFELQFYKGVDRSYNQDINDPVVFSPEFENIVSSTYEHSKKTLKNACRVGGEGEGPERKWVEIGTVSGLDRREMLVDANDISSKIQEGETEKTLTPEEYNNLLITRGNEKLAENPETKTFDGEIEALRQFVYRRDFNIGDIVTVKNEHGIEAHPRIIEAIESHDDSGWKIIPEFETMEVYN